MSHQVFISYSSKDKNVANAALAMLEASGIRCWMAPRDIVLGVEWAAAIMEGIKACRVMVVLLSESSNISDQVVREVNQAVNHKMVIIAVRIEDIVPRDSLQYYLSAVHWLDAISDPIELHLSALCTQVQGHLKAIGESLSRSLKPVTSSGLYRSGGHVSQSKGEGNYVSELQIQGELFGGAPFVVLEHGSTSAWFDRGVSRDDAVSYNCRSDGFELESPRAVTVWWLAITERVYKFNSSLEFRQVGIEKELGSNASHADFADVRKAAALMGGPRLIDLLRLREVMVKEIGPYDGVDYWNQGPFVTFKGQVADGARAYFISVHDGVLLDDWRIYDTIESHNIDVGSWMNNRKVLALIETQFQAQAGGGRIILRR